MDCVSNSQGNGIQITLNGQKRAFPASQSLVFLLQDLEIKADRVAIELDRKIVRPAEWKDTEIRDGAEIEIVHFVGGGSGN